MESALKTLLKYPGKRHIAVLGDILEMEEFSEEIHRKIGSLQEILELDALFLQGNASKYILESALENQMNSHKIFYFESQEALVEELKKMMQEGDVILLKASNGMHFECIAKALQEN